MTAYRISVTNADGSEGIEESTIEAENEDAAKSAYAIAAGMTTQGLHAVGLTEWSVTPV